MQIKTNIKLPNIFKSMMDNFSVNKNKKYKGILIDRKAEKPTLFNYGTYNHNVFTKEEALKLNDKLDANYKRLFPSSQN